MNPVYFTLLLVALSDAIGKKGEIYIDMLRILYYELAFVKAELNKATSAFDLFELLIARGVLRPTDISVLFQTIELTGLRYLKEIIEKYETYPDEVEITLFAAHRQHIIALGRGFSVEDIGKLSKLHAGGKSFSNSWKLIQHLEDKGILAEAKLSSFRENLCLIKVDEDFIRLLVTLSDAISKHDENHVDMLRILYTDHAAVKTELEGAKSAFDLFQILIIAGILKPKSISVLFQTIELTGLNYLKEILIERYKTYPGKVKIICFSAHRQQLIALGKKFSSEDLQTVRRLYEIPDNIHTKPWKVIGFLENKKIVSEENLPSFLQKINVGNFEASTSRSPKPDKDTSIIRDLLITGQKQLLNDKRMTPANWHRHHVVDIQKVFTELILLQSENEEDQSANSTSKIPENKPTSLAEALRVIDLPSSRNILITGNGGMGKTTLLRYIAYQWAVDNEHSVFADKLMFLINIGDIETSETFFEIITKKIDWNEITHKHKLSRKSVASFLFEHDDELMILLDGYDELKKNATDPKCLFEGIAFKGSTVVITSRREYLDKLLVKNLDVHIEVNGFSPRNRMEYIHRHFHFVGEPELGVSLMKMFRLGYHRHAFELSSSPQLLLQICTIWKQNQNLPNDLTGLFKQLICCILSQYIIKTSNGTAIYEFDRIRKPYKCAILTLGKCMYEELKDNKLVIYEDVLTEIAKHDTQLVDLVLKLGLVYEDTPVDPGDVRKRYTAPHKLFSEALAGFYLSNEIQRESLGFFDYGQLRENINLLQTTEFTKGFLGANAIKLWKGLFINEICYAFVYLLSLFAFPLIYAILVIYMFWDCEWNFGGAFVLICVDALHYLHYYSTLINKSKFGLIDIVFPFRIVLLLIAPYEHDQFLEYLITILVMSISGI